MADTIHSATSLIRSSRHLVAYTWAGISVESGVPPFRGPGGLWSSYDPKYLELSYFRRHPENCWRILKSIFYEHFAAAHPNHAHLVLARLEARGLLKAVITQNIENQHTFITTFPNSEIIFPLLSYFPRMAQEHPQFLRDL